MAEEDTPEFSLRSWLQEGNDLPLLELLGWSLLIVGGSMVLLDLLNIRIPYGRYGTDKKGLLASLGVTKCKLPARVAWFAMELPSFAIPMFLILNVGGRYIGEVKPNIVLLGMFLLHYFNR